MVAKIISLIILFFTSALKYSMSSLVVVAGNLGPWGTFSNVLGGIVGIVMFTVFGDHIKKWFIHRNPEKYGKHFSKFSRRLVYFKKYFGLGGLAFVTPLLLSIPLGVMMALFLTSNERKIILYMCLSLVFWSLIIFVPYYVFDIDVAAWIKHVLSL